MQTRGSSDQKKKAQAKKKAAPVFALDMKGNFVWTMRSATPEDQDGVVACIGSSSIPDFMVSSFLEDSPCCIVCEVSVKGTKEGEGYKTKIMGAAIVDVIVEVKDKSIGFDSGLVKKADILQVVVSPDIPDTEDVRKKLLLGAMKKLKQYGVVSVTHSAPDDTNYTDLLKKCNFSLKDGTFSANLVTSNPDPQKKLM